MAYLVVVEVKDASRLLQPKRIHHIRRQRRNSIALTTGLGILVEVATTRKLHHEVQVVLRMQGLETTNDVPMRRQVLPQAELPVQRQKSRSTPHRTFRDDLHRHITLHRVFRFDDRAVAPVAEELREVVIANTPRHTGEALRVDAPHLLEGGIHRRHVAQRLPSQAPQQPCQTLRGSLGVGARLHAVRPLLGAALESLGLPLKPQDRRAQTPGSQLLP
mmetsp:Transcript_17089/g.47034  ORF Transcript_17089/g.47034 Transcript_17089/m.47034 type:complete len:218 (+) Transcript_17089:435-1088(+)